MSWPKSSFWNYSISLYRRPGIEAVCLELQRRHGLDVNLLLFACWLSSRGIELDPAALARARKAVVTWQTEVVRPLRALRRRLAARMDRADAGTLLACWPDQVAKLRQDVLTLELDGEHLAQLALTDIGVSLNATQSPGAELAALNLARFWSFCAEDVDGLEILLKQAFPDATSRQLVMALQAFSG